MSAKRTSARLPELEPHLKAIAEALAAIGRGEDPEPHLTAVYREADSAVRAASHLAQRGGVSWDSPLSATFADIIGGNIRSVRVEAQWSQEELAQAMTGVGFSWKRLTVTEVEGAARRLSLEELLAIAALFAVPAIELMLPDNQTALEWPNSDLHAAVVHELFLGRGGSIGEGGIRWRAPIVALRGPAVEGNPRPAADLWRYRRASSGQATEARRPGRENK